LFQSEKSLKNNAFFPKNNNLKKRNSDKTVVPKMKEEKCEFVSSGTLRMDRPIMLYVTKMEILKENSFPYKRRNKSKHFSY
jgi:hypothetical protein